MLHSWRQRGGKESIGGSLWRLGRQSAQPDQHHQGLRDSGAADGAEQVAAWRSRFDWGREGDRGYACQGRAFAQRLVCGESEDLVIL